MFAISVKKKGKRRQQTNEKIQQAEFKMGQRLSRRRKEERHDTPIEARQTGRPLEESHVIEAIITQPPGETRTELNKEHGDLLKPPGGIQERKAEHQEATEPTKIISDGNNPRNCICGRELDSKR